MRRQTVAVIDNDPIMLRALKRLLSAHGFHVATFSSAEAFLGSGGGQEATCVVLDINLDGMSGLQLKRQLLQAQSSIPVIFITAFDSPGSKDEALALGCIAYLLKPFAAAALISAINQAIA